MAVAAAIGVNDSNSNSGGSATSAVMSAPAVANVGSRLNGKTAMVDFDINSSIEKMSLDGGNNGTTKMMPTRKTSHPRQTNVAMDFRRDSGWTNSTEGYGSMPSSQGNNSNMGNMVTDNSRRCSEVSVASNFSTTAVRNSTWCAGADMSMCSSRRSSMVSTHQEAGNKGVVGGGGIGQHLNRLQQKAEAMQSGANNGRQSVMSSCSMNSAQHPQQQQQMYGHQQQQYDADGGVRRASDPVRMLDRNFGVGAGTLNNHNNAGGHHQQGMTRHRSYTQLNTAQQQRVPLHGQNVRGMDTQGQNVSLVLQMLSKQIVINLCFRRVCPWEVMAFNRATTTIRCGHNSSNSSSNNRAFIPTTHIITSSSNNNNNSKECNTVSKASDSGASNSSSNNNNSGQLVGTTATAAGTQISCRS